MNATETIDFLRHFFRTEPLIGDVLGTSVTYDEKRGYASVFLSLAYHKQGGQISKAREQVAVYEWRRQRVEGEVKGVVDWVWWKQSCASAVPPVPF
ncbi:hypothetical protein CLAFUW4_11115 [Fulvia fulva]|uniref:Uncharacterized protein n=1 Tax=Passalora fulva TaxID=5499 RepID=A0A9Q8US32_PASFU|nr:uncharacterized protein CLAFUR5_10157 [Fulvia fulva]KAK4619649.1 hypothetical protein CLAFUR4_11120 [Fulvia fulva]KAK4621054.1 hypothetical protein CLAFUR0_11126 [Fulvia fulva]UJO20439.1 hypothetical protein CLAFUR5_10157 [Fulvia fulva]WPV17751.1 hypothetical protein CLAFUW4_11115 [Fulvia fulva]WPV32248.1 hypothetical protein CLAFUW7_11111 [Fulvia fulva]